MSFNTYEEASEGLNEEFLEIMDNVLLPILTGQSVIHIRTHEENRVFGICDTIPTRISKTFRVLHVVSEAGVESSLLSGHEDNEEVKFTRLSTAPQRGDEHQSVHIRALNSFLSSPDGGVLLIIGGDHACHQHELVRRLKAHAKMGFMSMVFQIRQNLLSSIRSQGKPRILISSHSKLRSTIAPRWHTVVCTDWSD